MNASPSPAPWQRANTDWFMRSRWGVLTHYLADSASNLQPIDLTPDDWNRRIDAVAKARLEGVDDARHTTLQRNWEAVVREWSLRWGRHVHGWWIDGPYDAPAYQHPDEPNYRSFATALKAGNPDSLVAFNNGLRTPLYSMTEYEDFTPGEIERDMTVAPGHLPDFSRLAPYQRFLNGAQLHVLTIMGEWWGKGPVRFPDELTIGYTKFINRRGGVVTWDLPLTPEGHIVEEFRPQLAALGKAINA